MPVPRRLPLRLRPSRRKAAPARFCYTCAAPGAAFAPDAAPATWTVTAALVGAPNAGKSSLSNALAQRRVSAVSRKVNTTQGLTIALHTGDAAQGADQLGGLLHPGVGAGMDDVEGEGRPTQIELWDTPGLVERAFRPRVHASAPSRAARAAILGADAWGAAADADVAVLVVDGTKSRASWRHVARVASELVDVRRRVRAQRASDGPDSDAGADTDGDVDAETETEIEEPGQLLVLSKCDAVRPRTRLLEAVEFFNNEIPEFETTFGTAIVTSARTGRGVDALRGALHGHARRGEWAYGADDAHGMDDEEVVRQHVWEKLLHCVHAEVPYRCSFESGDDVSDAGGRVVRSMRDGSLQIAQTIRCPTKGAVSMVIGPQGRTISWIREQAQLSLSEALGRDVRLSLRVALQKKR